MDEYEVAQNLLKNILSNVKIIRESYASYLEDDDFGILAEDADFQWFLDIIDEFEN